MTREYIQIYAWVHTECRLFYASDSTNNRITVLFWVKDKRNLSILINSQKHSPLSRSLQHQHTVKWRIEASRAAWYGTCGVDLLGVQCDEWIEAIRETAKARDSSQQSLNGKQTLSSRQTQCRNRQSVFYQPLLLLISLLQDTKQKHLSQSRNKWAVTKIKHFSFASENKKSIRGKFIKRMVGQLSGSGGWGEEDDINILFIIYFFLLHPSRALLSRP